MSVAVWSGSLVAWEHELAALKGRIAAEVPSACRRGTSEILASDYVNRQHSHPLGRQNNYGLARAC